MSNFLPYFLKESSQKKSFDYFLKFVILLGMQKKTIRTDEKTIQKVEKLGELWGIKTFNRIVLHCIKFTYDKSKKAL